MEQLERFGIDRAQMLFRPFTAGDVVKRAYYLLKEVSANG